jgi:FixJ family two-component response regulator
MSMTNKLEQLSRRELQVAMKIMEGLPNKLGRVDLSHR